MGTELQFRKKRFIATDWLMEFILLGLIITFALLAPSFFTGSNMWNILRNISFKGVIAMGMTMIIIAGEIDLSVGSTVGFAGVVTASITVGLMGLGLNPALAVAVAIAIALGCGYAIGIGVATVITKFSVPSFIATLASMSVLRGAALLISGGFPITGYPEWFASLGSGYIGPIPSPAIFFIAVMIIMFYVMSKTPFGRSVYAVGSNKESALLSGINVNRVKRIVFGITTMFAAGAGVMISSQLNSGTPMAGLNWEMDVISSVIIGGASLAGGAGTIRGTLVGCIFLGVLLNGMTLMNVNDYWQYIVRGMLILGAVLMNTQVKGRRKKVTA